jgi:periplasmic protein TonB
MRFAPILKGEKTGISPPAACIKVGSEKLPGIHGQEVNMFQDALFVPDRDWRTRAAALPVAALLHAVALTLLVTLPLVKAPDLPPVAVSDLIVVPALPATPLPPPKARAGTPGGKARVRRAAAIGGETWRLAPVDVPDGIVEEGLGQGGDPNGIEGGVDYGAGEGVPASMLGAALFQLVGEPAAAPVLAVGDVRAPKLVRRVEPDYPKVAQEARIEGTVILEATTDIYGRVAAVRVLRSVALLDAAAVDAVRQWVYEPLLVNGRPRPVTFTVTVRFVLKK